jgi:hypothetical protein
VRSSQTKIAGSRSAFSGPGARSRTRPAQRQARAFPRLLRVENGLARAGDPLLGWLRQIDRRSHDSFRHVADSRIVNLQPITEPAQRDVAHVAGCIALRMTHGKCGSGQFEEGSVGAFGKIHYAALGHADQATVPRDDAQVEVGDRLRSGGEAETVM